MRASDRRPPEVYSGTEALREAWEVRAAPVAGSRYNVPGVPGPIPADAGQRFEHRAAALEWRRIDADNRPGIALIEEPGRWPYFSSAGVVSDNQLRLVLPREYPPRTTCRKSRGSPNLKPAIDGPSSDPAVTTYARPR